MPGIEAGKVAVLMGGVSNEREVSLRSGETALSALLEEGFDAEGVDWKDGDLNGLRMKLEEKKLSAVLIALHGRLGEDGRVQKMLEEAGIPYTGSGVAASAVCFNKLLAKKVLESFDVAVPEYCLMKGRGGRPPLLPFDYPAVVKPAAGGSAIGVTIAENPSELEKGIESALREDSNVLVEEYIKGRELTASVLCSSPPIVLPLIEITTREEFYNYTAKYVPGKSVHILPAPLSAEEEKAAAGAASASCKVLGCRGFARVDMILSREGVPFVLDVNTIPGMTETSLLPESARAAGMSTGKLCRRMLEEAIGGHQKS